jgi:hypothetical protein
MIRIMSLNLSNNPKTRRVYSLTFIVDIEEKKKRKKRKKKRKKKKKKKKREMPFHEPSAPTAIPTTTPGTDTILNNTIETLHHQNNVIEEQNHDLRRMEELQSAE